MIVNRKRFQYKWLYQESEGSFRSVLVYKLAMVQYIPIEWAEPPEWLAERGYGLTCFESLSHAIRFQFSDLTDHEDRHKLWIVQTYGDSMLLPGWVRPYTLSNLSKKDLTSFDKFQDTLHQWPDGTLMFPKLKPVLDLKDWKSLCEREVRTLVKQQVNT